MREEETLAGIQAREDLQEGRIEELADWLPAELESTVPRGARDQVVELNVKFDQSRAFGQRLAGPGQVLLQGLDLARLDPGRRRFGYRRLQAVHPLPELEEGHFPEDHRGRHAGRDVGIAGCADE